MEKNYLVLEPRLEFLKSRIGKCPTFSKAISGDVVSLEHQILLVELCLLSCNKIKKIFLNRDVI